MVDEAGSRANFEMSGFATRDTDDATAHLQRLSRFAVGVEPILSSHPIAMRAESRRLGGMVVAKIHMANLSIARVHGNHVSAVVPVDGALRLRSAGREREVAADTLLGATQPHASHSLAAERAGAIVLGADVDDLAARAERLTGLSVSRETLRDVSDPTARSPAARGLTQTLRTVFSDALVLGDPAMGSLAASGYEDIVLNLLSATLLPKLFEGGACRRETGGALARRARDILHACAHEAIDLSRLAADLGASMRTLQQSFSSAYGLSLRTYLYERRLSLAREALLRGDPGTSVTQVALQYGFGDLSLFSAKYRRAFGEAPSQTLRAARGR